MMNIVCVGLVGLCAVLWSKYRKAVKLAERAIDQTERALVAGETLEGKLKEQDLAVVQLVMEKVELKRQLEEAEKRYADLLEEQYDNVVSIYKNR